MRKVLGSILYLSKYMKMKKYLVPNRFYKIKKIIWYYFVIYIKNKRNI